MGFSRALCIAAAAIFAVAPAAGYKLRPFSIFGADVPIPDSFHGKVYYLPEGTTQMPVFRTMKPIGDVYATTLNVPTQDYEEGFPGVHGRVEFFGIDYDGYFWISKPGEYHFSLASDDGSQLFIDDRLIVNNDGEHFTTEMRGKVVLAEGSHHIRVEYFQSVRYAVALILQIAPPGESVFHLFDMRDYRRPLEVDYNPLAPGGMYLDTLHPAARAAFDALSSEPAPHDFDYGVRAIRFPSAASSSQYVVGVEIPASSLTANKHSLNAHFVAIIRDGSGAVAERISHMLSADTSASSQPVALRYQQTVSLAPGFYTIETSVVDWPRDRASVSFIHLYNRPHNGLALSDVTLVGQLDDVPAAAARGDPLEARGKRVTPLLASVLGSGTAPYVYFVVYPNRSSALPARLQIQLARDGEVIATQSASLPAPDSAGQIPMLIGAASGKGSYDVQIAVSQGAESNARQIAYTIQ